MILGLLESSFDSSYLPSSRNISVAMADKVPEAVDVEYQTPTHHEEFDENTGVYTVKQLDPSSESASEEGEKSSAQRPKTTKDGIVLIPQPSDDPRDPLNWSWLKKHAVFLSLIPGCFLTDWVIVSCTALARNVCD